MMLSPACFTAGMRFWCWCAFPSPDILYVELCIFAKKIIYSNYLNGNQIILMSNAGKTVKCRQTFLYTLGGYYLTQHAV